MKISHSAIAGLLLMPCFLTKVSTDSWCMDWSGLLEIAKCVGANPTRVTSHSLCYLIRPVLGRDWRRVNAVKINVNSDGM